MEISDLILENKIIKLQEDIIQWATERQLWTDSSFRTYFEQHNGEPDEYTACVMVLVSDGGMWRIFSGFYDDQYLTEFEDFMDKTEFYYECFDSTTIHFYCTEDELNQKYLDYFEWQWIKELIRPNYTTLYQEIFQYFQLRPQKLYELEWRKFEILISEVFRNQGYDTELGEGRNDGGIDIKLFKKDDIDQLVTLVQVKKYKPDNPIELQAVSSLSAHVNQQKANRGLFVTTSRYLPVAERFAAREGSMLTLAKSEDVVKWCENAKNIITRDKSVLVSDSHILGLLKNTVSANLEGKIVVTQNGYNMVRNQYCLVVKESAHLALLLKIPHNERRYSDPPYNTVGYESPLLNENLIGSKNKDTVFRAKKTVEDNGDVSFWGDGNYYTLWGGTPRYFNHND